MPETRDRRLLRHDDDVVSAYSRRRNTRRGGSVVFVLEDESDGRMYPANLFRWRAAAMVGAPGRTGSAEDGNVVAGRGSALIGGRENLYSPTVRSGGGRESPLPIWYPRRPLNEITALVRAIERSTQRRRGSANQEIEGPILQDLIVRDPLPSRLDAQPEHNISLIAPFPTIPKRCSTPTIIDKVPRILLGITQECNGDSGFLTPQKKLLHNIDTVEKVVMEELQKLKRTPSAKREERQKRVRTLMSMR